MKSFNIALKSVVIVTYLLTLDNIEFSYRIILHHALRFHMYVNNVLC